MCAVIRNNISGIWSGVSVKVFTFNGFCSYVFFYREDSKCKSRYGNCSVKNNVFIMGSGRSGTTMVRDILGSHPKICSLPETSFFDRLWAARFFIGKMSNSNNRLRFVWLFFNACGDQLINKFKDKQDALASEYLQANIFTHQHLYKLMSATLAEDSDTVVVEKTPHHLLFMDYIAKNYPDAKFIYITRDPVDMVSSYISRGDLPDNYKQVAMEWVVGNKVGLKCIKKYPNRVIHIRYEDVIQDPSITMKKVFNFIGEDFSEQYLNVRSNSTFNKSEKVGIHNQPKTISVLTNKKSIEIQKMTADIARSFGYRTEESNFFNVSSWVYGLKYHMKYWLCLSGFRPMRIMLDMQKMSQMKCFVDDFRSLNVRQ